MTFPKLVKRIGFFPTFITGSIRQTAASLGKPLDFTHDPGLETVVLVPGAFCTSATHNRLAERLRMRGLNVVYPSDFPYFHGPLANMCPLEEAASRFVRDMASTAKGRGISRFWVAGHSNGGLIAMLAAEIAAREGFPEFPGMMRGVITMATPFRGTDAAILARPLVPVCRDISPGAGILDRIAQKKGLVRLCMLSGADFLVPFESQSLDGMKTVMMDGFQHMDFFVGTDEQVDRTAGNIKEAIDAG